MAAMPRAWGTVAISSGPVIRTVAAWPESAELAIVPPSVNSATRGRLVMGSAAISSREQWVLGSEVRGDFVHGLPADAVVTADVFREPFQHQEYLWAAADVRVDREGEYGVVHFAVYPVKLVTPHLLEMPGIHEPVTVGRVLDEHHRRQVVEIPVGPNFNQVDGGSPDERFHPVIGFLGVVDTRPRIAHPRVEGEKVVVGLAVVVREAVCQQQSCGLVGHLPPGGDVAAGPCPADLLDELDAALHDPALLSRAHVDGILVRVAVRPDLMTAVHDHAHLVGERL